MRIVLAAVVLGVASLASPAVAQQGYDPAPRIAAQKEAMKKLAFLDGVWRGEARSLRGDGGWHAMTQTERVGPMLDGAVKVIEGRGYEPDGSLSFNAFAVISYDPDAKTYSMRSYTAGQQGDFAITPTDTGFTWEIPAGPQMTIRYEAVVKDGSWTETGWRVLKNGAPPVKFIEFTVERLGDAQWPAAGFVPSK